MPALCDRGTGRHERHFSEPRGAFICIHEFLQDGFILPGIDLDDPAVFKGHAEIFDECASIGKRHGCGNCSFGAMTIWQGEHFLCWHICCEHNSIFGERLRADPFVPAWQAESEVCTWALIVQG